MGEVVAMSSVSRKRQEQDLCLLRRIKLGDESAERELIESYQGFIKLKANSYFIFGGDKNDLLQEGFIGFIKAIRDYKDDRIASFRNFAELCIKRQIITAIKTASRQKHAPLNSYLSLNYCPSSTDDGETTLGDILPSSYTEQPDVQVASNEERKALIEAIQRLLSRLETDTLLLYLEGLSYEEIADELSSDTKSVDNALQRVKRKIHLHLEARKSFESFLPNLPKEPRPARTVVSNVPIQPKRVPSTSAPRSASSSILKQDDIITQSDLCRFILGTKAGGAPY